MEVLKRYPSPPAADHSVHDRGMYDLAFLIVCSLKMHPWGEPIVIKRPADDGSTVTTTFHLPPC